MPPDDDEKFWLSPHVTLRKGATRTAPGGAEMFMGDQAGEPRRYPLPPKLRRTVEEEHVLYAEEPATLGTRRFEALEHLGIEVTPAGIYANGVDIEELEQFSLDHALECTISLQSQRFKESPPAVAYSSLEEIDSTVLHCAFWASHIAIPDPVFTAVIEDRGIQAIGAAIASLYKLRPLIESGLVVPIPAEFVGAVASDSALRAAKADLEDPALCAWVDEQLIIEGPTAREVLFMAAKDDLDEWPIMRTLGTPVDIRDDGTFTSYMLQPYRPSYDYSPWIEQERTNSVRHFVQSINEDVARADFFGSSYVTRSLFRANILRKKMHSFSAEQALMWTDTFLASDVDFCALAKAAGEDDAVADYRSKMGLAIKRAATLTEASYSAEDLHEELQAESKKVERRLTNSGLWVALGATIGLGSLVAGGTPLGWFLAGVGSASALKDVLPYFEKRREAKMEAPWLWYSMQPRRNEGRRRWGQIDEEAEPVGGPW